MSALFLCGGIDDEKKYIDMKKGGHIPPDPEFSGGIGTPTNDMITRKQIKATFEIVLNQEIRLSTE